MKTTIEVDLKWFCFDQNNSGGHFIVDDNVAHTVFIQARNAQEAVNKAHAVLDASGKSWCPCCGERWSFWVDDSDGCDEPTEYGTKLSDMKASWHRNEVRLHYFDGRVEAVTLPAEDKGA